MAVSRFPCRSCGLPTEAEDAYVVCDGCLQELETTARHEDIRRAAENDFTPIPEAPQEVEARLRKLLDDW